MMLLLLTLAGGCSDEEPSMPASTTTPTTETSPDSTTKSAEIPANETGTTATEAETTEPVVTEELPQTTATETVSAAASQPEEEAQDPLPVQPLDAILAGVDDGRWSLEEGLGNYLNAFIYGGDPLPNQTVDHRGAEAVVRVAHTIAARGGPDTRLARLYRRLVLPIEVLERHTAPGQLSHRHWLDIFLSAAYADTDCDRVIRQADSSGTELSGPCYRKQHWPNSHGSALPNHSIYYPARWLDEGDPLFALVAFAALAIDKSLDFYAPLGEVGSITLVFSTGLAPTIESAQAFVGNYSSNQCRVTVLAPALDEEPSVFQQILAHEIFHCFEAWNAREQYALFDGGGVDPTSWWIEGMAEYFGNVVYPRVNAEWAWVGGFDAVSHARSILQLSYENVVFFQYMGNKWGDQAIVELMRSLPTSGGRPEQAAALAGFRDMEAFFHEFAETYLSRTIRDSSYELLPIDPDKGPVLELPSTAQLGTRPFVIRRAQLHFSGEGSYTLAAEDSGAPGRYSARMGDAGRWETLPEEINGSECETTTQSWQLALTAVTAGSERRVLQIETERKEVLPGAGDCEEDEELDDYAGTCGTDPRYADMPDKIAFMESMGTDPGSRMCHPACTWRCFCARPEMHSNRLPTLNECYRYVENSADISDHWLPGPGHAPMTRCEWYLSEEYRDHLPGRIFEHAAAEVAADPVLAEALPNFTGRISAHGVLMGWCMRRCAIDCAAP